MLKKTIPFALASALILGACGNQGAIPKDNETPMEGIEDRERNWAPDAQDERRSGPNLDGLEDEQPGRQNGVIDEGINRDDDNMLRNQDQSLENR